MSSFLTKSREDLHSCISQIFLKQVDANFSSCLCSDLVHMECYNVRSNFLVKFGKSLILDDEDGVETREDRRLEVDLLTGML